MRTSKEVKNGNSQAERIPATSLFDTDDEQSLRKKDGSLEQAFHLLASLPAGFLTEREDGFPQACAEL